MSHLRAYIRFWAPVDHEKATAHKLLSRVNEWRPEGIKAGVSQVARALRSWCLVLAALASFSATSSQARADRPEPVGLLYRAPSGCADEAAFVEKVHARTANALFASAAPHRSFEVTIRPLGSRLEGELVTVDAVDAVAAAQRRTRRTFVAASCEELTTALALLVALAVDPLGVTSESAAVPPAAAAPGDTSEGPNPETGPPLLPPAAATVAEADRSTPGPAPPPKPWLPELGLGALTTSGVAPVAMVGAGVSAGVAREESAWWSPAVRADALIAGTGVVGPSFAQARFVWATGRAEGCPSRLNIGQLSFWPCLAGEVGAIAVSGRQIATPGQAVVPWLAAGALARARWNPTPRVFADVVLGATTPIYRPSFVFDAPRTVVYQAPVLLAHTALTVGVTFP
jgi:hypothetical protein